MTPQPVEYIRKLLPGKVFKHPVFEADSNIHTDTGSKTSDHTDFANLQWRPASVTHFLSSNSKL